MSQIPRLADSAFLAEQMKPAGIGPAVDLARKFVKVPGFAARVDRTGAMEQAEMRIANELAELESVREWVEGFGAAHALPQRVLTSLLVSFDEVLNNLISYGYADERRHEICLRLELAENEICAEIEDDGAPFDPLQAPPPALGGTVSERSVGGLGIHFLRTLNDEVTYRRQENKNRLRFKKCLVDAPR